MNYVWKKLWFVSVLIISISVLLSCSSHQHVLGDYLYDDYLHWQECEDCHEKVNHFYHTYGAWQVVKEPTETEEGLRKQVCSACGFYRTDTLSVVSHTHRYGAWEFLVIPSSLIPGKIQRICSIDSTHIEVVDIPILNQTYYRYRILQESTCQTRGVEIYSFTRDGQVLEIRQEMPLAEHTYDSNWSSNSLGHWHQATCEHSMLQKDYELHTYKNGFCTVCHWEEPIIEHIHTYGDWGLVVVPTMETIGELRRVCLTNDEHVEVLYLPILNSKDYTYEVIEESTCSKKGKGEYSISIDKQVYKFPVELELSNHTFDTVWSTDNRYHWHQATCIHNEEKQDYELHDFVNGKCRTCNYIGYSEGLLYEMNEDHISYRIIGLGSFSEKELVIPGIYQGLPVTKIAASAFKNCTFIEKIRILDGVEELGDSAFMGCSALKEIELPNTLRTIETNCFKDCSSLQEFIGNDGLERVKSTAFKGCVSLTSLSLPNTLLELGESMVDGCLHLNYSTFDNGIYLGNQENPFLILYKANDTLIKSCSIHENTKFIAASAFNECRLLESISIPNQVISIGSNCFYYCVSLEYIILGKGVLTIDRGAFGNCTNLRSIFYIGTKEDFQKIQIASNNLLEKIYYYSENPSSSEEWTFDENQKPVPFH